MQSARIWFRQTEPPVTLASVKTILLSLGYTVEETQWSLEDFVVPQLRITQPVDLLIQLNCDDYVIEEAKEFSDDEDASREVRERLPLCNARLEIGGPEDSKNYIIDDEVTVFSGWTEFDPGKPEVFKVLKSISKELDGILEDNVNGHWWMAGQSWSSQIVSWFSRKLRIK